MNGYQLYLENIINALARVGIHYPLKLESYEDLFYTAESLGSFLEINSFLQRVGEGYSIAGFDESITYRSYWYSEFYLEFQERVLTTDSYLSAQPGIEDVVDTVEEVEVEEVEEVTTPTETPPTVRYSSITGTNSDGFDEYGVPLDLEDAEELSSKADEDLSTENDEEATRVEDIFSYSEASGTNSDGFDYYGVDIDEDETETSEESEIEDSSSELDDGEFEEVVVSSSSGEFDFPDEEVADINTSEEVVTTATLSSDGFDLYGVELEDSDDSDDSVGSDNDELDPDDPDSGVVLDLVGESVSESGGYSEGEYDEENDPDNPDNGNYVDVASSGVSEGLEEYDEENDPNNPDNSSYTDLVENYSGYSEEYDEENDPDNPDNRNYVDTVSSSYVEYDEENDPDNPDNGNYVDTISSNYEEYNEENDPDNPDNGSYVDTVSSSQTIDTSESYREVRGSSEPVQSKPQQPKTVAQKNIESTQNILNILGKFEKTLLGKVKKDGKK
jgi:hypothetical protein TTHERM_00497590